LFGIQTPKSSS